MEVAMNCARILAVVSMLACTAPGFAAEDEAFGHALTLVQMFLRVAAQSDDPKASLKALDDVLAGRNTEANRAFAGLLEEATSDMPTENRDKVASIARELASTARKEIAKPPLESIGPERSLQARKDLTAMGLRYYDDAQYLDAVRRNDALAVELYLMGRGINASAKGPDGRSALDIARANNNDRLVGLLSRNLP
jgi:hypothetical protein